nr:RNA-directed DNA polymerase, eukaryota, reverse transcriptase zinc-binding domain protein [Tanacetum cinerariifolium]
MGSQHSKEDEVQKISTSAFVTKFPDQFTAKELWNTCKQYGYVVDAFIPNRISKAGKQFGFIRFTKVFDAECLVNNLCTIWVGRHKIHANVARFQRVSMNNSSSQFKRNEEKRNHTQSWVLALGFLNFNKLLSDFIIDGRVTWVELEGIPLKMWSENTFKRIAYKWGVLLHVDDQEESCFHRKRLWINTIEENDEVDEFDDESLEIEPNGDNLNYGDDMRGDNEIDEVPDTIFEEKLSNSNGSKDTDSLKYPPGFTPRDDIEDGKVQSIERNVPVDERDEGTHNNHEEVEASGAKKSDSKKNSKGDGANAFNMFISSVGLEEVPLKGCSFTWCHKSAIKISKLDRFLISKSLMSLCPNIFAITLDRFLSDHRPILLRESKYDYGPIPFRFFHYWFEVDGIVKLVEETWNEAPGDTSNVILNLMKKLKFLKKKIRASNIEKKKNSKTSLLTSKMELAELDAIIDKGDDNDHVIQKRTNVVESILKVEKLQSMEAAQKAKIKQGIEALILKTSDANMVKDFRPISLIGSFYKIIAKILENQLVILSGDIVIESKKKQSMIFKVDFEKAFDSVGWDYLDDVLKSLVLEKSGAVGFKVAFDLHRVRVVDSGMFKGVVLGHSMQLSHMFYADDVVFLGQWKDSNIDTIVHVLDCVYRTSGLCINMSKSKLIGISIDEEKVDQAASKIGCVALKSPFSYLGSKVCGIMSRIQCWNEIVDSMIVRLSKWKMKTLSIGGRLTLLKSVLGSMPIYHMSIFKVPMKV